MRVPNFVPIGPQAATCIRPEGYTHRQTDTHTLIDNAFIMHGPCSRKENVLHLHLNRCQKKLKVQLPKSLSRWRKILRTPSGQKHYSYAMVPRECGSLAEYNTVEPVLGNHPFCPAKAVAQDRWSLITGRTKIMFYRCVHFYTQPGSK